MHSKLLKYFTKIMPVSKVEIEAIVETMNILEYKKGTILLKEGQISSQVYFVLEGCIRQYILTDGEEKTINFFTEEQWVVSTNNFNQNVPSNHFLECCTDCSLVVGDRQKGESLYKRFPNLETISRKVMENIFIDQQEKLNSYITDKPEQRYIKLLKLRPDLFQSLPQFQIASYIGVKPESLSRIRKRILKSK